jgi:all-trans-retinol dehydrogenase (NAD+)
MGFDEALRMELRQIAPGVKTTVVCPFYIDTGMFTGVQSSFPLLLPILKQDEVARKVVQRGAAQPASAHHAAVREAPSRHPGAADARFDALTDYLGVNVSMADFVGRTTPTDVEASTRTPTPARRTGS